MMFILTLLGLYFSAHAQPLPPLQDPPKSIQFKPAPVFPKEIPCADLVRHIQEWGQFRADADVAVASYGEQLKSAVDNWVRVLKPLEKTTVTIEDNYFKEVVDGGKSLDENMPSIYENSDYFDSHLKQVILPTLEKCLEEKGVNGGSRNNRSL